MPSAILATRGNDLNQEKAFALMAALPDDEAVIEAFKAEGVTASPGTLHWFRKTYPDRLEKARQELAPAKERALTNGMLDNATLASEAVTVAIKLTKERLDNGAVQDPAKCARDLADVLAKTVDKKLALEGRPTAVVEKRDTADILRALEAKGVVVEVEPVDAEVVEDA